MNDLQTGERAADLEFAGVGVSLLAILLGAEGERGTQFGNCRA
jgi:hypothetical protein